MTVVWTDLFILLFAMFVHEVGHYLSFLSFKMKPSIKLTWYAIIVGENCYLKLTPIKAYFVNISGILFGAVVLQYFNVSVEMWLIYILVSGIDLINIMGILGIKKEWKNLTLLEIANLQMQELNEKHKDGG